MAGKLYESDFEETTIERLKRLGYGHLPAHELYSRADLVEVVLRQRLEDFLWRRYPKLPTQALASQFMNPDGLTWQQRNQRFHDMLVKGIDFAYEVNRETKYAHVTPIDWDEPESNDFVVVNQVGIEGRMARRPDMIVYVNGLPLIVFELKSPYKEDATVDDAYTQINNYTYDISQLFNFNAFSVVSDGITTLHGMPGAPMDFFAAWKSIDGRNVDNNIANSMKTLIEGLFPKDRLLKYIRDFIAFMDDGKKVIKIGAKYHQFFGVRFAVEQTIRATRPDGDRKIGVIWHTQGSGKSISMLFFTGILSRHPEMGNPSIVIQVDRADLDEQLYKTFVSGKSLVGHVHQACSADDLRDLLRNEAGQIVFSTIEKFRLKDSEAEHPVLSGRQNIVVISDEAHRTQYQDDGFAGHLRTALPNASFIGFTGTPISFADRDSVETFGHIIHTYDMVQSVEDKSTVPIYYESRLIPIDLSNADIDDDYKAIIANAESGDEVDQYRAKWAALEKVVGTERRLETLAKDILHHFGEKASRQDKAMIVCMSREICVALYDQMRKLTGCPEIEIIFSGDVSKDPQEWREIQLESKYAHIKTRDEQEEVKARLKDPDDPLKMVIVRDMWLTGFDAPPVSVMYVDKPMKGHNLMQAIARVNRVFPGKNGGLVVDYIGIATALKEATRRYTDGGGRGKPTFNIEQAVEMFQGTLSEMRSYFPSDLVTIGWRGWSKVERDDWLAERVNELLGYKQEGFLQAQLKLKKAHQLVRHLNEIIERANEVLLYEILATQVKKIIGGDRDKKRTKTEVESDVNRLVNESVEAYEVLDLFKVAGLDRPDLSILDESFLADLQEKKHVDLRLKLLQKLLEDKIAVIFRQNKEMTKTLKELLEKTLAEYHAKVIQAADVLQAMIEVKRKADQEEKSRSDLGLSDEEVAFYNVVTQMGNSAFSNEFVADLIHKVVKAMKQKFQPDWTSTHRADVLASVNLAVKHVLMKEKIKGEQLRFLTNAIVEQAKEQYKGWPLEA
ncbi:type I restriction endonuclease subunit R [Ferroacidibacillus organovorans]|uniref:Type I restriction enzyme endonuclease subunit n=1 Tax=Ferroacidibacillus organovorans TaxID=1765683 RepID=A0A853K8A5_9BACL|nr:type I restriction endonuclease subunit R [Ferroacidibacillus organovorans]KYP80027.1 deoxyribonuclease HsdR [Ferroacidibacillus organovorans]OAG93045.1 deoxyribonuclease HsdR [Ferroacidibacillus organovorans]